MDSILLIANYRENVGGISGQVKILYENLKKEGYGVSIFNTRGGVIRRLFLFIGMIWSGLKHNVFHIHGCSFGGFFPIVLGVIIGKLMNKKIIITYHGGGAEEYFAKNPKFIKYIFSQADRIIVLSEFLRAIFDIYELNTIIIPNILEIPKTEDRRSKILEPKIITTRTLNPIYDIITAVKAFEIVKDEFPDASLRIVGTGTCETALKDYVKSKNIDNVQFIGKVANNKIFDELKKATIWCNPTTKDNMPVSLLEAMGAGLLIVTTNAGGIPAMVDTECACIVDIGDYDGMAKKIINSLKNQPVAKSMIENAYSEIKKYSWEYNKEKIHDIYSN